MTNTTVTNDGDDISDDNGDDGDNDSAGSGNNDSDYEPGSVVAMASSTTAMTTTTTSFETDSNGLACVVEDKISDREDSGSKPTGLL